MQTVLGIALRVDNDVRAGSQSMSGSYDGLREERQSLKRGDVGWMDIAGLETAMQAGCYLGSRLGGKRFGDRRKEFVEFEVG